MASDPDLGRKSKITASPVAADETLPFETHALDLAYPLLGPRPYSHGSSMIEGMLAALALVVPDLDRSGAVIRQFKVIRQFSTLSRAEAMTTAHALKHPRLKQAVARLDIEAHGERLTSLLFERPDPALGRLPDYDPDGYLAEVYPARDGRLAGGRFDGLTDFVDLIRGLNECNRQLTVASFPHKDWSRRVRWAYIQNMPILSSDECASLETVSYTEPEAIDIGRQRFEIKHGTLAGGGREWGFDICFFIELPEDAGA